MSNPTFGVGSISFPVADAVERFRLVSLDENGVSHADGSGLVYGAVTEPGSSAEDSIVAVHRFGVVPVEVDGDVADFVRGSVVSVAGDGKVAVGGSAPVGVVVGEKGGPTSAASPSGPAWVLVDLRLGLPGAGGSEG